MERGEINNNNKIKLQVAPQILWTKQRITKGALRLGWKIPRPQFWSASIKVIRESVHWITPLKIVSPSVLQGETVCLHKSLSWHLHCNHKQHLQRVRPRGEKSYFLKARRRAQSVLRNWRNQRLGWLQWQGSPLPRGLICSRGSSRAESHCELSQRWLKHHLKAARLPRAEDSTQRGPRISHPGKENLNGRSSFTLSPQKQPAGYGFS